MKQKIKREIAEWVVLLSVIGIIYLGGWHVFIIGKLQQAVLATGIISPDYVEQNKRGSYDFWLEDLNGKKVSFQNFKGKVIFINFWATWCPPCIAEMPDIHRLYNKRKEEISFVMISMDTDRQKAYDFLARKQYQFPVYFLQSNLPSIYDTHSIPTTYVLDRNGKIKVENHGMAKYNTQSFNEILTHLLETK
ncbi:MAG: TlpA disulfide reductase family protein [Bacteroidota bacterium]